VERAHPDAVSEYRGSGCEDSSWEDVQVALAEDGFADLDEDGFVDLDGDVSVDLDEDGSVDLDEANLCAKIWVDEGQGRVKIDADAGDTLDAPAEPDQDDVLERA